jgi:hypothetical protein
MHKQAHFVLLASIVIACCSAVCAQDLPYRPLFSKADSRAIYGKSAFPEPLLAPEMDVERELRFDWLHQEKTGVRSDEVKAEIEYSFGLLTLEVEAPYEREEEHGHAIDGMGSIELSARYPLWQYVSPGAAFEYTLAGALEVAVPSGSRISKDTEIVPQLYQLMRLGDHFTLQTSVGYSALMGPEAGGVGTLEYAVVAGYSIDHSQLPIPGVLRLIPMAELVGERAFSGADQDVNRLRGVLGMRFLFDSLANGAIQPRFGIGYVAPLNSAARDEFRWGIIASFVLEFP